MNQTVWFHQSHSRDLKGHLKSQYMCTQIISFCPRHLVSISQDKLSFSLSFSFFLPVGNARQKRYHKIENKKRRSQHSTFLTETCILFEIHFLKFNFQFEKSLHFISLFPPSVNGSATNRIKWFQIQWTNKIVHCFSCFFRLKIRRRLSKEKNWWAK